MAATPTEVYGAFERFVTIHAAKCPKPPKPRRNSRGLQRFAGTGSRQLAMEISKGRSGGSVRKLPPMLTPDRLTVRMTAVCFQNPSRSLGGERRFFYGRSGDDC